MLILSRDEERDGYRSSLSRRKDANSQLMEQLAAEKNKSIKKEGC